VTVAYLISSLISKISVLFESDTV